MKKTSRRTAGFTLIELLTVIAIIGILAGIIIPTVGNVQERARRTTDLSNMKQVIQGAIIYANDNNGAFPKVEDKLSSSETSNQKTTIYRWIGIIAKN
ncbi:MAG: prepilin-type N-terminal cleavage/methylation domain-containing protein, partial [Opitutaceae bacterium]|nr:prepilin-type N-terminal cleavage/methylation domain-containing protein [Opitutaceae bacterium]